MLGPVAKRPSWARQKSRALPSASATKEATGLRGVSSRRRRRSRRRDVVHRIAEGYPVPLNGFVSNGCGVDIVVKDDRMVGVRGRATDVVNHGRLGPKGLYGSTVWSRSPDRLTRPLVRGRPPG